MQCESAPLRAAWAVLGVPAGPTSDQVTRAYRHLARSTHPDVSTNADAAARFDAATNAYRLAVEVARRQETERAQAIPPVPAAGSGPPVARTDSHLSPADVWLVAGPVRVRPLSPEVPSSSVEPTLQGHLMAGSFRNQGATGRPSRLVIRWS